MFFNAYIAGVHRTFSNHKITETGLKEWKIRMEKDFSISKATKKI